MAYLQAVQARAEHAERTREQEARHRVTEERMRIARDLHDVVAHQLVLAGIQASAVAGFLPARPGEAERLVTELTGTTSSALRELRATVGLLRAADDADDADESIEPIPGLFQLADLTDSFGTTGLVITITTEGEPRDLAPSVDLTAYRIVQEALTHVTKHAATHAAEVRLVYSPDRLSITITNDTRDARPLHRCRTATTGSSGCVSAPSPSAVSSARATGTKAASKSPQNFLCTCSTRARRQPGRRDRPDRKGPLRRLPGRHGIRQGKRQRGPESAQPILS
ncbi:sensor histidine kinase [Streptomyces griseorubiginosus]|uniref:sensor histidine kinase n=1 Tax=Streptomyces griseorubiginosus TaxID=67304 RepID=UPI00332B9249